MPKKKKAKAKPTKKAKTKKLKQKIAKKKVVTAKTRKPARTPGVMAVVPYSQIIKPEVHRGKMSMIPTSFTEAQLKAIVSPTPRNIIKQRPGKGGGQWNYVPGWWFKKKANFVFGFSHDFEILGERIDDGFITVKGKVTVRNPKTGNVTAVKTDFGGAEIKYKKGTKTPLDIGNDFKAAATDAFKRCMVQFGFAMDVYGVDEMHSQGVIVKNDNKDKDTGPIDVEEAVVDDPKATPYKGPKNECQDCANPMTDAEVTYSKKFFKGKKLCRGCQKLYRDNGWK